MMIAYCGPGRTPVAAIILALAGEFPDRIEETDCLPDPADIIVIAAPPEFITGPVQLRDPPRPGLPDVIVVNRPGDAFILGGLS